MEACASDYSPFINKPEYTGAYNIFSRKNSNTVFDAAGKSINSFLVNVTVLSIYYRTFLRFQGV